MSTISPPPSPPSASALPAPGEVVRCRTRAWLVDAVEPSPHGTKVSLACLEDDAQGEGLEVLWEAELDTQIIDRESWKSIGRKGFDDPRHWRMTEKRPPARQREIAMEPHEYSG